MDENDLLSLLRTPRCYPHAPDRISVVQTHISIVGLADELVYKLKKPLRLPFLDFSTVAARREACRAEVRLNRRLCPDVYLGTAALRPGPAGPVFAATGDDEGDDDLDVAVVMRRLPEDRMLDQLLEAGAVEPASIRQLATVIAAFHRDADRGERTLRAGAPAKLAKLARENFEELEAMGDHGLSEPLLRALAAVTKADFDRLLPALGRRAAAGFVVDGHGDLHARNICMTDPPSIYDCIEFNDGFRCGDVATEIAFLTMDLRYRGADELARVFVDHYVSLTGDRELPDLLPPLVRYRAVVRAKVAAMAAAEPELGEDDRAGARGSAARHLQLAAATALEQRGPLWLVLCGPPGSGKSSLAAALCGEGPWPSIATDRVRKELAGLRPTERAAPTHYTPEFSARTYGEVRRRAGEATRHGAPVVVLDGNFPTPGHRAAVADAARQTGAQVVVLHVDVPPSTGLLRVRQREQQSTRISDAGPEQHDALRRRFQPPGPGEGMRVLELDGQQPPTVLAAQVLAELLTEPVD